MHTSTADRFAAVLWDFDGTLVDTEPRWVEAELAILSSYGIMWESEKASSFTGGPMTDVCEAMAGEIGESATTEDVRHQLITMVSTFNREREVPWRPGVLDLLTEIREAGVPMAIVTGSAHAVVEPVLEAIHDRIGNPFDTVVTFDDVTPGTAKPAPDPYLLAAERLGVDIADCLAIEDSPKGTTSATTAGAAVLTVDGLAEVGPGPRRVHRPDLSGLSLADLVSLWHLADEAAAPVANGGGGVLRAGERITLTDPKGRKHSIVLQSGGIFHTTKGAVRHDDLIGGPQGVVVTSVGGLQFLAMRPNGRLHSYERRQEFADVAHKNVESFYGEVPSTWDLKVSDLVTGITSEPIDRAILDMLAPWECVETVGKVLVPGGVLCCYVATTTQMGRVMDTLRADGGWTEPQATETTTRDWHAEGLAIRPAHGTTGHTGFLVISRRLAPGVTAPVRKRRPAPGAYGPDYHGPRPRNITEHDQWRLPKEEK